MNFFSNVKWIFGVFILALFCRLFIISVYRVPSTSMEPAILSGELIIANQLSYGFKLPWMESGYFESDPVVGDIVAIKMRNKMSEDYLIKRISAKGSENTFEVRSESETGKDTSALVIQRDQILSKAWFVWFSMSSTQDSISGQKSFRWNRFLTRIQ
jgi:signal peptidase I